MNNNIIKKTNIFNFILIFSYIKITPFGVNLVPGAGLEPARYTAPHFKCGVSAYSTTRA